MKFKTEEQFLRNKYRIMKSRLKTNPSYSNINSEYEDIQDFVRCWAGKVDWRSNPQLDRIDHCGNYSQANNQWLTKEEHRLKSSQERAKLTDAQALEILQSDESTWKWAARLENVSQNLIHRLKSGKSYKWLSLRDEEEKDGRGGMGIVPEWS
jgi:hypothetical protein